MVKQETLARKAYTVPELARAYGYSRQHIYDLVRVGELSPVMRSGRAIRIPVDVVDAWDARNRAPWTEAYEVAG